VLSVNQFNINDNETLSLYPNPTNSGVTIRFNKDYSDIRLRIYSLNGQVLMNKTYKNSNEIKFDIEGSPGLYLAEITAGNYTSLQKIVKF